MEAEILKKFLFCLIPLVILWALSFVLVRLKAGNLSLGKNNFLEKIETLALNQHNSIHLVKLGEAKVALLGVSQQQTNVLLITNLDELQPLCKDNSQEEQNQSIIARAYQIINQRKSEGASQN